MGLEMACYQVRAFEGQPCRGVCEGMPIGASGPKDVVTGFSGTIAALRDNPRALLVMLGIFFILNIADFLFTFQALSFGATEANPLMEVLFSAHPFAAGLFKISVSFLITVIIWHMRYNRRMIEAFCIFVGVYAVLCSYHTYNYVVFWLEWSKT